MKVYQMKLSNRKRNFQFSIFPVMFYYSHNDYYDDQRMNTLHSSNNHLIVGWLIFFIVFDFNR